MKRVKNILGLLFEIAWQSKYDGDPWIKYAIRLLSIVFLISVFHKFIANDVPIVAKKNHEIVFPVLQDYGESLFGASANRILNNETYEWSLYPLIPYRDKTLDQKNIGSVSPFENQNVLSLRYRHWLGTDQIGRDVLAGLIYGLATALKVGFYSGLISLIIGLLLGGLAGYFGDHTIRCNGLGILSFMILFFLYWYISRYNFLVESFTGAFFLMVLFSVVAVLVLKWSKKLNLTKYKIPLDLIVVRGMEIFRSIPVLIFLIAVLGIIEKASIWNVILLIGLIRWPSIARYVRAEMLAVRNEAYIRSAQAIGTNDFRILWKHAFPNIISPVLVSVAFGFAISILLESSLSFLGIGVPMDEVTLGSLLSEARRDFSAWWLALFPGLMIFILLSCFNLLGRRIEEYYNPKLNQ